MEVIKGKYATAKVYADDIEQYAKAQIQMICDNEVSDGAKIRIMPDVHPGKVGTIGLTMTIGKRIIPNLLGVDIGCGVSLVKIKDKRLEFQKLDTVIRERVPAGFRIRTKEHPLSEGFDYTRLKCARNIDKSKAYLSLGTLGGGNHFIEVDRASDGSLYIAVHTGSRHLGMEVTNHYINEGARLIKEKGIDVPYPMTYVEGEMAEDYMWDVQIVQEYAALNRRIILTEIIKGMKAKDVEWISSVHNYIDTEKRILRKGAISAESGETVLIPVNMKEGIILGRGLGNEDWNYSAPHGSGRLYRRDEVKEHYTVSSFKSQMKGIYCSCIGGDTLYEAPFAYRGMDKIREAIKDTVEVTDVIKPVYSYKAGGKG